MTTEATTKKRALPVADAPGNDDLKKKRDELKRDLVATPAEVLAARKAVLLQAQKAVAEAEEDSDSDEVIEASGGFSAEEIAKFLEDNPHLVEGGVPPEAKRARVDADGATPAAAADGAKGAVAIAHEELTEEMRKQIDEKAKKEAERKQKKKEASAKSKENKKKEKEIEQKLKQKMAPVAPPPVNITFETINFNGSESPDAKAKQLREIVEAMRFISSAAAPAAPEPAKPKKSH